VRYLLDTNIMIAAMKGVATVKRQLEQRLLADILLSPVVLGELEFGVDPILRLPASNLDGNQRFPCETGCKPRLPTLRSY